MFEELDGTIEALTKGINDRSISKSTLKDVKLKSARLLKLANKGLKDVEHGKVDRWIASAHITRESLAGQLVREVYTEYWKWCDELKLMPYNRVMFGRQISKLLGITTKVACVEGLSSRVFES